MILIIHIETKYVVITLKSNLHSTVQINVY